IGAEHKPPRCLQATAGSKHVDKRPSTAVKATNSVMLEVSDVQVSVRTKNQVRPLGAQPPAPRGDEHTHEGAAGAVELQNLSLQTTSGIVVYHVQVCVRSEAHASTW